jgi:hypothetical protein
LTECALCPKAQRRGVDRDGGIEEIGVRQDGFGRDRRLAAERPCGGALTGGCDAAVGFQRHPIRVPYGVDGEAGRPFQRLVRERREGRKRGDLRVQRQAQRAGGLRPPFDLHQGMRGDEGDGTGGFVEVGARQNRNRRMGEYFRMVARNDETGGGAEQYERAVRAGRSRLQPVDLHREGFRARSGEPRLDARRVETAMDMRIHGERAPGYVRAWMHGRRRERQVDIRVAGRKPDRPVASRGQRAGGDFERDATLGAGGARARRQIDGPQSREPEKRREQSVRSFGSRHNAGQGVAVHRAARNVAAATVQTIDQEIGAELPRASIMKRSGGAEPCRPARKRPAELDIRRIETVNLDFGAFAFRFFRDRAAQHDNAGCGGVCD